MKNVAETFMKRNVAETGTCPGNVGRSPFKRINIRLKEFNYTGNYAYFITICTYQQSLYFTDHTTIKPIIEILKNSSEEQNFIIYAYCFMPDHLHILLVGKERSNLVQFVKDFKQKTGFYFKKTKKRNLWQKSYYEHTLRKEETLEKVALYIWGNPVRKNIVDNFRKYPYSGSFIERIFNDMES